MRVIAVYTGDEKHPLQPIPRLLDRSNQALRTLERYKARLDSVSSQLSALEVEDIVTLREVVMLLQRTEMVRRIAEEIEGDIIELGADGRLVYLQLEEVIGNVEEDYRLAVKDYFHEESSWHLDEVMRTLAEFDMERLLDPKAVAETLHLPGGVGDLDTPLQPRGYRMLARIPRLPESVVEAVVHRFGDLQKIMRATLDDLEEVEGVGETRARAIKDGLARLAESSILDRYS
jgi:diadenylate cyclase